MPKIQDKNTEPLCLHDLSVIDKTHISEQDSTL